MVKNKKPGSVSRAMLNRIYALNFTTDMPAYTVEYSPSSQAKCRMCGKTIPHGSIRLWYWYMDGKWRKNRFWCEKCAIKHAKALQEFAAKIERQLMLPIDLDDK